MTGQKILIADDDESVQRLIKKALSAHSFEILSALNGEEAIELCNSEKPDLVILDISMPKLDGREVIKTLRRNMATQMIPVMILTSGAQIVDRVVGFELGADDYVTKPFDVEELRIRVQSIFRRNKKDLSANPLTRLPGNPMIEENVTQRIRDRQPFAFLYIDIDYFKAFNDAYGYARGDQVIQETASILLDRVKTLGSPTDFLGHIGGDDFVIMTKPELVDSLAMAITNQFDQRIPRYYNDEERLRGYIVTFDRLKNLQKFPLITLTVAVVSTENRDLCHYAKVVEIASEIKRYLKSAKGRKGSVYLKDRRSDPPGDANSGAAKRPSVEIDLPKNLF